MPSAKEENLENTLLKLGTSTDEFEGYEHNHAFRIALLAESVAHKFNLAAHDRFSLRHAAFIHDVGELTMNRDYIKSTHTLSNDERLDMQRHTVIGEQEAANKGLNRAVQLIIRWHHEWWNGAGYPDALSNEQIPLLARILRVVDTYCAMTDDRPYRVAYSEEDARQYLIEWAGIEFDPKVVKAFLELEDMPELKSYALEA